MKTKRRGPVEGAAKPVVDALDAAIIGLLQEDGRMAFLEIARQLGVSEGTVRYRVARLRRSGMIEIRAVTDVLRLGYQVDALIHLRVRPAERSRVAAQAAEIPGVRFVGVTTGSADIVLEAVFGRPQELSAFLAGPLAEIPGITHVETLQVIRIEQIRWNLGHRLAQAEAAS